MLHLEQFPLFCLERLGWIYFIFFSLKSSALDFHLTVEEAVLSETSTYENLAHSVFAKPSAQPGDSTNN